MSGDWLTLGAVGVLAAAGVVGRGSFSRTGSSPLDLPLYPGSPRGLAPGFYYKAPPRPAVVLVGMEMGRDGEALPLCKIASYRFPHNPDDRFTSPYVNFDNMHFQGGHSWRPHNYDGSVYFPYRKGEMLTEQMISGRKAAAVVVIGGNLGGEGWGEAANFGGDQYVANESRRQSVGAMAARARAAGLVVGPIRAGGMAGAFPWSWEFSVAHSGTLRDTFDLHAWKDAWVGYGAPRRSMDALVAGHGDRTLVELIEQFQVDERSLRPAIVGLILGYPISTTASFPVATW